MECSPPAPHIHEISQARILEWVIISSSRGPSQPRDWTHISFVCCTGRFFTTAPPGKTGCSFILCDKPITSKESVFLTSMSCSSKESNSWMGWWEPSDLQLVAQRHRWQPGLVTGNGYVWKFFKSWECQTTLPASWEICMQVKKQQLEPDTEQQTDSKSVKEYVKAVYCHPACLTYMQSTSCKMPGWMKHKLE